MGLDAQQEAELDFPFKNILWPVHFDDNLMAALESAAKIALAI